MYTVNSLKVDSTVLYKGGHLSKADMVGCGPIQIKFLLFLYKETLYKADTSLHVHVGGQLQT